MSPFLTLILSLVGAGILALSLWFYLRSNRLKKKAESLWRAGRKWRIDHPGSTRFLTIIPLIDFHSARPDMMTEAGVSYLIETENNRILFDTGLNTGGKIPSPLMQNMASLGISPSEIDTIVISHNHPDHVGGRKWAARSTFCLGSEGEDLSRKRIFAPFPMRYPGNEICLSHRPTVVAKGVATIGAIGRALSVSWVEEQALAVNVEGKGVVIIVGCGHQKLPRILERTKQLFPEPIYGLIGGLHYPIPKGRLIFAGLDVQRTFAAGDGLFRPLRLSEVKSDMALLKRFNPQIVALSAHDSSDEVLDLFRNSFGQAWHDLLVGEKIVIL